ncbi:MAG: YeeE/YedE family protein [Gemmatimonadetes bacterium]|nr:YeeE/YedE family protein [Gemmatimonadota bacterium]
MATFAAAAPPAVTRNAAQALTAWAAAAAVFVWAHGTNPQLSMFWAFGLAFGFVLQRGRFCFASAFRDLFLLGHGRNMKGVLLGLAVASVGFGLTMSRQVPMTSLGFDPPTANILPLGAHTAVGGILFGVGMVLAGGCVSGSLYRMAEGYVASWATMAGLMGGLLAANFTWNWWWSASMADAPRIWLPRYLGHPGALALTLLAMGATYVVVLWWEHRSGMVLPATREPAPPSAGVADDLRALGRTVFVRGWPILIAGAALGGLNVLLFSAQEPWGFTGEVGRWGVMLSTALGFAPPPMEGAAELPGCVMVPTDGALANHMTFQVGGMFLGSFAGAVGAGEFKLRIPKQPVRYLQSLGGGVLMGYGAGIAMGCTIGAFFSSIPSLALNGWAFAIFLGLGAWIGTKIISRNA